METIEMGLDEIIRGLQELRTRLQADTARRRRVDALLARYLTPASDDHAPSVGGALELQDRQRAEAELRALVTGGGQ